VPNTASSYPIWAVSPERGSNPGQGFASLPAGSFEGWIIQNNGLPSNPNSKGVRIGYDGGISTIETLYDGSVVEGTVKQGAWRYYKIDVTDQNNNLRVFLDDPDDYGSQDADLYVRYGALPNETTYDYCPWINGDENVCVTKIIGEDFEGSWGPYGNNPPQGWTISDFGNENPKVWNTNDWFKYYWGGSYGNVAEITYNPLEQSNDWLLSPTFNIPSSLDVDVVTLEFDHQFRYWNNNDEFGYVLFKSDQYPSWITLATYSTDMASIQHISYIIQGQYKLSNCFPILCLRWMVLDC